ncbi:carcinine hydrolase/isopenicillin-N N-acyltransferase family protein [Labilibaculum sp.]|uniref:carcinine hydrolase/isopenicillin-N N-acyltransferase family protein n=1 Tax=Labilibaculum sp. TaxID=2060723 RepID=UPI0035662103
MIITKTIRNTVLLGVLILLSFLPINTFACTTFLISGKHTTDGKPLLFKNRDTKEMNNSLAFFKDGKYDYMGLVNGADDWKDMVWGGYNETGFAIINSAAYNNNVGDTAKIIDQEGIIMKRALQTCKTIEDFENLLNKLPKPSGLDSNFGVIDAFGGAAFYETGNYSFMKVDANDPTNAPNGILVRTNHSISGVKESGMGYCRYNTATAALNKAAADQKITPLFLFNHVSRNLYHSLTNTDLLADIPPKRDVPEFKFFIDYIPRIYSASAIMIVGAKDEYHEKDAMMWTILGFPLTSVAIPTWISAGEQLPKVAVMDSNLKSPICTAALKFKEECFPLTYDKGWNYLNLSVLVNQEKTGYMQLLKPIEEEIFCKANSLIAEMEKGQKSEKNIRLFYAWLDQYLAKEYKNEFDFNLGDF